MYTYLFDILLQYKTPFNIKNFIINVQKTSAHSYSELKEKEEKCREVNKGRESERGREKKRKSNFVRNAGKGEMKMRLSGRISVYQRYML